jgi:hypothetical protein
MRLDGKRVVVIGGSSGIGLETARLALSLVQRFVNPWPVADFPGHDRLARAS